MADATTYPVPRFKVRYNEEVRATLKDELGLDNVMDVPRFEKIVINMGVGEAVANSGTQFWPPAVEASDLDWEAGRFNEPLHALLAAEAHIAAGTGLPIGLSVVAVGRKERAQ